MKYSFKMICAVVLTISALAGNAQSKSDDGAGLYQHYDDYTKNSMSSFAPCDSKQSKIKLNDFFASTYVSVIHDGKKTRFQKDKLYGYHDCGGDDYRFYGNAIYKIIDTTDFYLYSRLEYPNKKGYPQAITNYYFSTTGSSNIAPLTTSNLEAAFPSQHEFRYLLEQQFRSDAQLASYDKYSKKYKVKYLFENANNK
jgi:hypothetical protein